MLTIDGQLSGYSVCIVGNCCIEAESEGRPVHVFLRDVPTVDEAGQMLLRYLAGKGVRLTAHGVYTSYLIEHLTQPKNRAPRLESPDCDQPTGGQHLADSS